MFQNRVDAGKRLARELGAYREENAAVLALPRGGVVIGETMASELCLPLDIVSVRKIGHPLSPEYAIGAVDEYGTAIVNEAEAKTVDAAWLKKEMGRQQQEAKRRIMLYRGGKPPLDLAGKIAIITDDGIATGFTMRLAVRLVKAQKPKKIIVAVPVAPPGAVRDIKNEGVAEVVVLEPPEEFAGAVGAHYAQFEQVKDDEVIKVMKQHGAGDSHKT